jgi:outer membrane protein assembly factor BamB
MSATQSFERQLAAWMADEGSFSPPVGAVDEALTVTSRLRPRPGWLALLRETPMTTQSRVLVGSPTRRLTFALVALVLAVAVVAAGALLLNTKAAGADWPIFRGSMNRAGVGVGGPVGRPAIAWELSTNGVPSNVAIAGTNAYVATDARTLYAIDITTGQQRWTFESPNLGAMTGPTVDDGAVFLTDGAGAALSIDAATGSQRWSTALQISSASTFVVGNGLAYVGGNSAGDVSVLVALDAKTGQERWRVTIPGAAGVHNPAYADGVVYFGTESGTLEAVTADTGQKIWTATYAGNPASAVVVGGTAYFGIANSPTGPLVALDAKTGEQQWQIGGGFQSPAVDAGIAYVSGIAGVVAALRTSDATEVWHVQLPGAVVPPAVADGIVYVAAQNPNLVYALDAKTGGVLWTEPLDAPPACCVAPSHGLLFAAAQSGKVTAIRGDGARLTAAPRADLGSPAPSVTTGPAPSTQPTTTPTTTPSFPPVATLDRTFTTSDPTWTPQQILQDKSGRFWVGDPFHNRIAIFDRDWKFLEFWGERGDQPGQFAMLQSDSDAVGQFGFTSDGRIYVLDSLRRVQIFDKNREYIAQFGTFGSNPGQFAEPVALVVGPDDVIYVLDDVRNVFLSFDRDGNFLKEFNAYPNARGGHASTNGIAIDAAGNLYITQLNPWQVTRFDGDGNVTGVFGSPGHNPGQFGEQPGGIAADAQGRVFIGQGPSRGDAPAILVFDKDGAYLGGFGTNAAGPNQIPWPTALLLLGDKLYVSDVGDWEGKLYQGVHVCTLLPPFAP